MGDSSRRDSAGPSGSLVPGVIYEWTSAGTMSVDPIDEPGGAKVLAGTIRLDPGVEAVEGYRLAERIGQGFTGEVWRAIGPGGVVVAFKFIEAEQRGAKQELRSLALMLEVRHANLVTIFGIWERPGWTAIGMDLADGSLLDRFEEATVAGEVGLDFVELTDVLRQAARGIDFLNEPRHAGLNQAPVALIHRDIKPENLLLVGGSVKVGDFGLVKQVTTDQEPASGSRLDEIESLITTYSAPEVRRGASSSRSDQYSLAATYCHLRGGRAPATPRDTSDSIDLTMLPAPERPVVAQALATDPNQRWPSCSSFVDALVATLDSTPVASTPVRRGRTMALVMTRRSRRIALSFLLVSGILVGFALIRPAGKLPRSPALTPPREPVITDAPAAPGFPASDESGSIVARAWLTAEPPQLPLATVLESRSSAPGVPDGAEPVGVELTDEIVAEVTSSLSEVEIRLGIAAWLNQARARVAVPLVSVWRSGQAWFKALPRPASTEAPVEPLTEPLLPRTATVIVRMPTTRAELVVRGEVGRGNPDEWYGPRRIIHSPPLSAPRDYLVGAFWTEANGQPTTRSQALKVEPGRLYEVDLRSANPTAVEVPRSPRF